VHAKSNDKRHRDLKELGEKYPRAFIDTYYNALPRAGDIQRIALIA
jgi:hypothetical protein